MYIENSIYQLPTLADSRMKKQNSMIEKMTKYEQNYNHRDMKMLPVETLPRNELIQIQVSTQHVEQFENLKTSNKTLLYESVTGENSHFLSL